MKKRKLALILFFGICLISCQSYLRPIKSNNLDLMQAKGYSDLIEASKKVILLADNQLHTMDGEQSWLQNKSSDTAVTKVTIRPPILDFYSTSLLSYALSIYPTDLIIHLGDASDVSCTNEMSKFIAIMDKYAPKRWIMLPGNHDSLYFGNYQKNGTGQWSRDCDINNNCNAFMNKQKFINLYLEYQLGKKYDPDSLRKPHKARIKVSDADVIIHWLIEPDEKDNWNSYLLQFVDIAHDKASGNKIWMILADTTNYRKDPKLFWKPAGKRGEISKKQWDLITDFMNDKKHAGYKYVMAGHHPASELDRRSQKMLAQLSSSGLITYISAHTHHGGWHVYTSKEGSEKLLELNIGSITDSKKVGKEALGPSFRTFQVMENNRSSRPMAVTSNDQQSGGFFLQSNLVRLNHEKLNCEESWRFCDNRYQYDVSAINFKKAKVEYLKLIINFLLNENEVHFRKIAPEKLSEFTSRLSAIDTPRGAIGLMHDIQANSSIVVEETRYKACQAYWAGILEKSDIKDFWDPFGNHTPDAFDESVSLVHVPINKL